MAQFTSVRVEDIKGVRFESVSNDDPILLALELNRGGSQIECLEISGPLDLIWILIKITLQEPLYVSHVLILVNDQQSGKFHFDKCEVLLLRAQYLEANSWY